VSWLYVNLERLIVEEKETHSNHGEKDADGTEDGLGWCDAREFLREIEAFDDRVERGENAVPLLGLLGFVCHGRSAG